MGLGEERRRRVQDRRQGGALPALGGSVGMEFTVDPDKVAESVGDAADAVGDVVGDGVDALGDAAGSVKDTVGGWF